MSQRLSFKIVNLLLLALIVSVQSTFATVSVKIFMKDEGINETSIARPRIYIQNTGTESISNFIYYYYITADNGKTPMVDVYYAPNCVITLENMGSGLYRAKYNFSGFTLQAGAIAPDANGNVVGMHYSDYSYFNKLNDISYLAAGSFVEDTKIPVYSSTGTLLYGSDPGSGQTIPPVVPPASVGNPSLLSQYVIYGTNQCILSDRVVVHGGLIGSKGYTEVGCNDTVYGSLLCAGNAFLRTSVKINGDVTLGGTLSQQTQDSIGGILTQNSSMVSPIVPTVTSIPIGSQDMTVQNYGSLTLAPGNYNNVHVYSNASITLSAGVYNVRSFILEPDVHFTISASQTDIVQVNVSDLLSFGDRTIMQFSGTAWGNNVRFYSNQQTQFRTGTNATIYGIITIPNAQIDIPSQTHVIGALYGQQVNIEPDATVCRPAVLSDLWYSGWVYTPAFDANTLSYSGAVNPLLSQIQVAVTTAVQDATATINGQPSPATISLSGGQTTFGIDVTNNAQCGGTHYTVTIKKQSDFMVYVNANSGAPASQCDGKSWYTAFKDLQQGIDTAAAKGKQVWVAEGTYKPSKRLDSNDARSATFLIKSGIEIKGGFNGTESDSVPTGSPYNTKLSGDIAGNDDSISVWPPSVSDKKYLTDNVYHVVTTIGSSKSIYLNGLVIQGGVSNGSGDNRIGAGILNKNSSPTLEYCGIKNNYSDSSGAGIYDAGGFASIVNCLFKNNVSLSGNGSGLYVQSKKSIKIDASVFDSNATKDTTSISGGGALYISGASTEIVNSIFTRNTSNGKGGAIFNNGSVLKLTNCTFYNNSAVKGAGGINNQLAKDTIVNTILWDNNGEISDTISNVTYSCVKDGYRGNGNISSYPGFINADKPEGDDGKYGTNDDGLRLASTSPCLNIALASKAPPVDILGIVRPSGIGVEMGAYEFLDVNKCNKIFLGRIKNGEFYENNNMTRIMQMVHPVEIYHYSKSNYHRVLRAYLEKSSYTDKPFFDIYIQPTDVNGNAIATEIDVKLFNIGEENGLLVFQSMTPNYQGKMIIFTGDPNWHGYENPWAYIIYVTSNPQINYRVPRSQFK